MCLVEYLSEGTVALLLILGPPKKSKNTIERKMRNTASTTHAIMKEQMPALIVFTIMIYILHITYTNRYQKSPMQGQC